MLGFSSKISIRSDYKKTYGGVNREKTKLEHMKDIYFKMSKIMWRFFEDKNSSTSAKVR